MKKILFSLAAVMAGMIAFAQHPKDRVIIKGTLKGDLKGYNKIKLYTRTTSDSAEIKNGEYTFSFPFTTPVLKMFLPEYITKMHQMYQPFGVLIAGPGTYYVSSDIGKGMYQSSEVKGPEAAELYRTFELENGAASVKINTALGNLYGKDWYRIEEKDARYAALQSSRDSLQNIYLVPLLEKLLKNHPESYAGAFVLAGNGRQIASIEKKEQLLAMLGKKIRQSDAAKKFADHIQGIRSAGIGKKVADFVLPDPKEKNVTFSSLKGKYVLIDFWASWCAPCRQSFPRMREVYAAYKDQNFEIYSISIDESKSAWLKAVADENNPWLQSLDNKNISQRQFAVTGVPSTFLIGPDGVILASEVGFDPKGGGEMEKKLASLFGKTVPVAAEKKAPEKKDAQPMKAIPMTRM